MSEISRLRSKTLFKKTSRHYFTNLQELRKAHEIIFKNEFLFEDRYRVSNFVSILMINNDTKISRVLSVLIRR